MKRRFKRSVVYDAFGMTDLDFVRYQARPFRASTRERVIDESPYTKTAVKRLYVEALHYFEIRQSQDKRLYAYEVRPYRRHPAFIGTLKRVPHDLADLRQSISKTS